MPFSPATVLLSFADFGTIIAVLRSAGVSEHYICLAFAKKRKVARILACIIKAFGIFFEKCAKML